MNSNIMKTKQTVLFVSIALALAACGSSGGGAPNMGGTNNTPNTPDANALVLSEDPNANGTVGKTPTKTTNSTNSVTTTTPNFSSPAEQITAYNNDLKSKSVSTLNIAAENSAKMGANGNATTVMIVDFGINPTAYDTLATANNEGRIDPNMYVSGGSTMPTQERNGVTHASAMGHIVLTNAPNTGYITNYGIGANETMIQAFQGSVDAFEQLANRNTTAAKTIVLNNSLSDRAHTNNPSAYATVSKEMEEAYVKGVNGKTGLVVFATGNANQTTSANSAQIPNVNSALKNNFIAVTGLDENGNQIYNDCGASKEYCVAAPANVTYSRAVNGQITKFASSGTSNAAAYVSAVAAGIATTHDWMSADQVGDVIKTTTDKKGTAQEYGLGVVNATKAMKGPAAFTRDNTFVVDGVNNAYYFSNDISSNSAVTITKKGKDDLVLTGNNTYTGNTIVSEGKLVLNGKNTSSMQVESNGTLVVGDNTKGISSGNVYNNGTISSETLADLTVNGNLVNTNNGTIKKAIGSTINVTGNVTIQGGTLDVTGVASGYITAKGTKETAISGNNVTGSFKNVKVSDSSLIGTTVSSDNKGVYVITGRNTVGTAISKENNETEVQTAMTNDAKVIESTLTKIDEKIDNNVSLTQAEESLTKAYAETDSVTSLAFAQGSSTHSRMQESMLRNTNTRSVDAIRHTQSNTGAWLNYTNNQPEFAVDGVKTDSEQNGVSFGVSQKLTDNSTVSAVVNQHKTDWTESLSGVNKSATAKSNGVDLVYNFNSKSNAVNYYTTIGADRVKIEDGGKGYQYRAGVGANKVYSFNNMAVIPEIGLFYNEGKLKDVNVNSVSTIDKLKNQQLTARVGVSGAYQFNDMFTGYTSVGLQQDLINKGYSNTNIAGVKVGNKLDLRKETQGDVKVGVNALVNGFNVNLSAGYQQVRNWNNKSVNLGVNFEF